MLKWLMLLVYICLSVYILWRVIHWLKIVVPLFKHKRNQAVIITIYIVCAMSLILGSLMPKSELQRIIYKIGNVWLGLFIYIVFFLLIADIVVLILKLIHRKKPVSILSARKGYYLIGFLVVVSSALFTIYGHIHSKKVYLTTEDVYVNKEVNIDKNMTVALVADLHLGYSIGMERVVQMVDKINAMNPDLVVIAGDIFDNDYDAIREPQKIIDKLKEIKSKYGVYATWGNHDVKETLVGGFSISSKKLAFRDIRMDKFLAEANIKQLDDDVTTIANESIYLIGRLDGEKAGDGTSDRMSIEKLTQGLDKTKPIFVIDHEPSNLDGIAACGVDLMLSGHTHAGQFFPLTLTQGLAWDNYHGCLKVGNMYSVVTSGVGLYGPDMRVFTNAEVMEINVHFY